MTDEERIYLVGPELSMALERDALATGGDPVAWSTPCDEGAQCASPVLYRGLLFAVSDVGTIYCHDAATGETLWTHRVGTQHYASPVISGDVVYFTDTSGRTTAIAAAAAHDELSVNDLGEAIWASPALADGRIFMRTDQHLYCIGS